MTDRPNSFPGVLADREDASGLAPVVQKAPGKAKRPPSFTAAQRLAVFEAFGAVVCCQGDDCENVVRIKGCDIDHHLAIIDGGTHELSNWRPLCDPCHAKKSAREHKANWHCKRVAHDRAVHEAVLAGTHKREPSRLKSRGFDKTRSRKFGGKVVSRG